MRLLLDTHAFLWWAADDPRLPSSARRMIGLGRNEVLLSAVSGWEIVVNVRLGRLSLPDTPERFVPLQLHENAFGSLPVTMSHALAVGRLPDIHRDPFDRLLVAQAVVEDLTLVTADEVLSGYPVRTAW